MSQRLSNLEGKEVPFLARPVYWISKRIVGKVVTPIKVKARRPGILWTDNFLGVAIDRSGKLPKRLHTIVQLRAAQIVECPF
jgi:hypothetical protein